MAKTREQAVAYLRVSGKGQVEGDGFPRQREAIARYAKAARMCLVGEYLDGGVSGTTELDDRPGLAALLDRVKADGIRAVLVERADRVARDLIVGEMILMRFREAGARVIDGAGNDLTADDDPSRCLIRQVLGAVSEYDKRSIVIKLRAARDRIREKEGRCEGTLPFGAKAGEGAIVEHIRQLRRKRPGREPMSYARIAEHLNAEGCPSRFGRPWVAGTVWGIIRASKTHNHPGTTAAHGLL